MRQIAIHRLADEAHVGQFYPMAVPIVIGALAAQPE
jgi:hypothetical protein